MTNLVSTPNSFSLFENAFRWKKNELEPPIKSFNFTTNLYISLNFFEEIMSFIQSTNIIDGSQPIFFLIKSMFAFV